MTKTIQSCKRENIFLRLKFIIAKTEENVIKLLPALNRSKSPFEFDKTSFNPVPTENATMENTKPIHPVTNAVLNRSKPKKL